MIIGAIQLFFSTLLSRIVDIVASLLLKHEVSSLLLVFMDANNATK
jgi:hypothetical protein